MNLLYQESLELLGDDVTILSEVESEKVAGIIEERFPFTVYCLWQN